MRRRYLALILILLPVLCLPGQTTLQLSGLNEMEAVYRTAPDSLNVYFRDTFAFNLGYRDFAFGMKFIAELPKHAVNQAGLYQNLQPGSLKLGWQELYASYTKEAFSIHAGTTEETFGQGLSFRSYRDPEFDEDHRLESFLLKYDDNLQFKAIYGAIESPTYVGQYDLAYGTDLSYPLLQGVRIGGSALAYRNLQAFSRYAYRDIYTGRLLLNIDGFDGYAEYAKSESYRLLGSPTTYGSAIYASGDFNLGRLILGGAYKKYDRFNFRLQDLPMANYHEETLSDALASGVDEEGWQARGTIYFSDYFSFSADYAEAWDSSSTKQMNDFFTILDWAKNGNLIQASFSHVEKVDDALSTWQKEQTPALEFGTRILGKALHGSAELKLVEKQNFAVESSHYEPKLQTDISFGKLSVSIGSQSHWADFDSIMESRYWLNTELKYPLFPQSEVVVFAGKEAGGKVCRNGVCRYVAPFEGLKLEINTRF